MHLTVRKRFALERYPRAVQLALMGIALIGGILFGVGCDSGESGNGPENDGGTLLENTSSVTVDLTSSSSNSSASLVDGKSVAKASGSLTVAFYYQDGSESNCVLSTMRTVSDTPYNDPFDPTTISGDCSNPSEFDGVKVKFTPGSNSSAAGLVLILLGEEGTEITSDDDPSDGLGISITVSDEIDLPDDIGDGGDDDDGDGDEGGGGGGDDGGDNTATQPPEGLSATSGNESIDLSWGAVGADDLGGYNVYRSTSSISDVSGMTRINGSLLSSTSYTDDGLTNGTTYHYVVTAVDESGNESGRSDEVRRAPFDDPPSRP